MRFVRVTGAALVAIGLGFVGSFLLALRRELAEARGTIDELRVTTDFQRDELERLRTHVVDVDRDLDEVRVVEARGDPGAQRGRRRGDPRRARRARGPPALAA
jgi:hypothetical protein